jgi:hypothetical protein
MDVGVDGDTVSLPRSAAQIRARPDALLRKPFRGEALLDCVRRALSGGA